MRTLILGGGLIGMTTAYFLNKSGHEVAVIDRHEEVGKESSYANGAQLSYCHAEPWSSYGSIKMAIKYLGKDNAPLLFRLKKDIHQWSWLLHFIGQASRKNFLRNTTNILHLGLYSRQVLHEIEGDLNIDFHHQKGGKTFIFKNEQDYTKYLQQARLQESLGSEYKILDKDELIHYEPAMLHIIDKIYKSIREPLDESADSYEYCVELRKKLADNGVKFFLEEEIKTAEVANSKITKIITDSGKDFAFDNYILCLGAYSAIFARKIGIKIPIYPLKGYSITVNSEKSEHKLVKNVDVEELYVKNSITDLSEKIVYSRIGNQLRVAGTAEFNGHNHEITQKRIDMLRNSTKRIFPMLKEDSIDNSESWSCLRPSTPDGCPIIGKSHKYSNLFYNTGHGTLGWTQTFASAKILDDIINEQKPSINISGYSPQRYGNNV